MVLLQVGRVEEPYYLCVHQLPIGTRYQTFSRPVQRVDCRTHGLRMVTRMCYPIPTCRTVETSLTCQKAELNNVIVTSGATKSVEVESKAELIFATTCR
jgi:hypothetical protein